MIQSEALEQKDKALNLTEMDHQPNVQILTLSVLRRYCVGTTSVLRQYYEGCVHTGAKSTHAQKTYRPLLVRLFNHTSSFPW